MLPLRQKDRVASGEAAASPPVARHETPGDRRTEKMRSQPKGIPLKSVVSATVQAHLCGPALRQLLPLDPHVCASLMLDANEIWFRIDEGNKVHYVTVELAFGNRVVTDIHQPSDVRAVEFLVERGHLLRSTLEAFPKLSALAQTLLTPDQPRVALAPPEADAPESVSRGSGMGRVWPIEAFATRNAALVEYGEAHVLPCCGEGQREAGMLTHAGPGRLVILVAAGSSDDLIRVAMANVAVSAARTEVAAFLKAVKARDAQVCLLSGDARALTVGQRAASEVGAEHVFSNPATGCLGSFRVAIDVEGVVYFAEDGEGGGGAPAADTPGLRIRYH